MPKWEIDGPKRMKVREERKLTLAGSNGTKQDDSGTVRSQTGSARPAATVARMRKEFRP
jgi:hypothetical protein